MKKIIIFFIVMFLAPVFASDKIHVMALDDFSTVEPSEHFKVRLIEEGSIDNMLMLKDDIIKCSLIKVVAPKRGKRNAQIYFELLNYEDKNGEHEFIDNMVGKYAASVLNKEKVKNISPKKVAKTTVSVVGNQIFKGLSYGVSFADGVIENPEGNRFKSGAKQVYEDSIFSYVEEGKQVEIKKDDTFYLIVKRKKD